jgi:hypothetical protein
VAVLSVDLAYRRWSDVGLVVLDRASGVVPGRAPSAFMRMSAETARSPIACQIIPSSAAGLAEGPIDADILAGRLNHLCAVRGIRVMMLDGPQAWKSTKNGFEHARVSERQLNTAAKTGLPGMVKPVTYRRFAEFCLDVYDALCRRGWRRMDLSDRSTSLSSTPPARVLVESSPYAAWKSLGLTPLPAKRRTKVSDLAEAYAALRALIPFTTDRPPNHDQLQAIVGGLAGLDLEERNAAAIRIVGNPPRREEGHWREGFIVLPLPPQEYAGLRWLN